MKIFSWRAARAVCFLYFDEVIFSSLAARETERVVMGYLCKGKIGLFFFLRSPPARGFETSYLFIYFASSKLQNVG